jgi:hypothetical protein
MGVNLRAAAAAGGIETKQVLPMAPPSIKLIVGGAAPTVSKKSRRENPVVEAPDLLRLILILLSWPCVWQIYFPELVLSNTLLPFPLRCGEV